jgi:8-oxo-dGTP diphosphatase
MPGGGIEYDETFSQGLEREVFEETGYLVEVGSPIAVHSFTVRGGGRDGRPYKSVRLIFSAVIVGGRLGTTEIGGSTDFAEWVPLEQIQGLDAKAGIVDVAYAAITARR